MNYEHELEDLDEICLQAEVDLFDDLNNMFVEVAKPKLLDEEELSILNELSWKP